MFHTIYQGNISTRTAELFRVSIQQDMPNPPAAPAALHFPYDEPLLIEREEAELHEPVITTTATLRVISPADRTFLPLSSLKPASVRLLVHRRTSPTTWQLYYAGTLDTDTYEEPYAYHSDYIVELSFSDFGILHRKKFSLKGYVTLALIINTAIQEAALPTESLTITTNTATTVTHLGTTHSLTPDNILLNADNFYDEDNEPLNLHDAIAAVLQPLAWRIVAQGSSIHIFDLHSIYNQASPHIPVKWLSDDQNLTVAPIYNDIIITLSPYVDTGTPDEPPTAFPHKVDPNVNALGEGFGLKLGEDTTYYTAPLTNTYNDPVDYSNENRGFTIFTSDKGTGATIPASSKAKFFKIATQGNGDEAEGVAMLYSAYGDRRTVVTHGDRPYLDDAAENIACTFSDISIPPLTPADKKDFVIRISLPALVDYRFNPFAEPVNEPSPGIRNFIPPNKESENFWKQNANYIYIPVRITFTPANSATTYSYNNRQYLSTPLAILRPIDSQPLTTFGYSLREWFPGTYKSYLAYYTTSERQNTPAINGAFTENRQSINPHTATLASSLIKADPGEHISLLTLPDDAVANGGTVTISLISNKWMFCKAGTLAPQESIFDYPRWVLFKLPTIEFRHRKTYESEFPTDDIETRTLINPNAEESLEIELIFGSQEESPLPTARSNIYFLHQPSSASTPTRIRIDTATRAGHTGTFQQLLAATIYSQYADPHIRLTGTCQPVSPTSLYTDPSSPSLTLIPIASYEDIRAQTAEVTFAQLSPESYKKA